MHSEPQRDAAPARRRVLAGRRGGVAPPALSACASTSARRRVAPADGGSAERSLEGDAASCQRTLASHEQPRQHDSVKEPTSRRVNTYASHDCLLLLCPPPTKDGCLGTPLPWLPHLAVQDRPRSAAQQVLVLGQMQRLQGTRTPHWPLVVGAASTGAQRLVLVSLPQLSSPRPVSPTADV